MATSSHTLTAEQIRRMEENKRRALALRAQRQAQQSVNTCTSTGREIPSYTSKNTNSVLPPKQNINQRVSSTGQSSALHQHTTWSTKSAQQSVNNSLRENPSYTSKNTNSVLPPKQDVNQRSSNTGQSNKSYQHTAWSNKSAQRYTTFDNGPSKTTLTSTGNQNVQPTSNPVGNSTEPRKFYSSSTKIHGNNTAKSRNSNTTGGPHAQTFYKQKVTKSANSKPSPTGFSNQKGLNFGPRKEVTLSPRFGESVTGTCILISRKRFEVQVGYCAPLIEVFKQMPTKYYDMQTKVWSFELKDYEKLVERIQDAQLPVQLTPLPKPVLITFKDHIKGKMTEERQRRVPEADLTGVEPKLVNTLLPFQREGVNFAIWRNGRVLLADDMGLGKTMQALCVAAYYRKEWPLLIVTPSSLRLTWAEAFHRWLPNVDPQSITVMLTGKDNPASGRVTITSYDLMARCSQHIRARGYKVIIMDESHVLKNFKTARTKAAMPLLKAASRVLLLSGTPALSRPSELFTQLSAVDPRLFTSFHEFGIRYCQGKQTAYGWDYSGSCNMKELQLVLEERVMIRRQKKDVLSQLPSKQRQVVVMEPGVVNMKSFQAAAKEMTKKHKNNAEQRGALLQYFNETALVKIPHIKDYVLDLLEADRKFLVFAHHQIVLDALSDALNKKGYGYIRIDGKTPSELRQQHCDRFQTNENCQVALLSITAASTGLTLTAASLVVFAELFWNPGVLVQAEDRAHRIGQQDCVNVHYLVARGTADDYIWPLVQGKLDVLCKAGLTKDDFSTADTTSFKDPKQESIISYLEKSFSGDDPEDDLALLEAMEDYGIEDNVRDQRSGHCDNKKGSFVQSDRGMPPQKSNMYAGQSRMDKFVMQQPDTKVQGRAKDDGKAGQGGAHYEHGETDAACLDDIIDDMYLEDPLWLDDLGEDDFKEEDVFQPDSKRQRMA